MIWVPINAALANGQGDIGRLLIINKLLQRGKGGKKQEEEEGKRNTVYP